MWHTRLTCPGGGKYQWNEKYQSYESTIFGLPARPKRPDVLQTSPLAHLKQISLGLTFEDDGLRARTEIIRKNEVESTKSVTEQLNRCRAHRAVEEALPEDEELVTTD